MAVTRGIKCFFPRIIPVMADITNAQNTMRNVAGFLGNLKKRRTWNETPHNLSVRNPKIP
jgi:hypothetical protein